MPPRKKVKTSDQDGDDASHNGAISKTAPNHASGARPRSRRGCLENVQELPLEISLQIFGLLHPKDLLNLARTSKAFRSFFLNRANSLCIWKSSLNSVKRLPKKPECLSEPAYAHLMFNPFCQGCGKSGIQKPIWQWLARYCPGCVEHSSHGRASTFSRFYLPSNFNFAALTGTPDHSVLFNFYRTTGRNGGDRVHKLQLECFVQELETSRPDEEQLKALIRRQCTAVKERAKLAERLKTWYAAQQEHRSAELEEIREQRFQDILERLSSKDCEWFPEMKYYGKAEVDPLIRDLPFVRQSLRLTDRGWPKVLVALKARMEVLRKHRLRDERDVQIKERLQELKESILDHYVQLPKTASMDCRPTVQNLVADKECYDLVVAPVDQEVTRHTFAQVLPAVCSRWEARCVDKLRGLVKAEIPSIPDDVDPLRLAIAVFDCDGMRDSDLSCSARAAHRYPTLMAHTCLCRYPHKRRQGQEESNINSIASAISQSKLLNDEERCRSLWCTKIHRHLVRPHDIIRMRYIVSALGLDPARATHEEIRDSDAWLWCRLCSPLSREAFTWEGAFLHGKYWHAAYSKEFNVERNIWERVSEEDTAAIRQLKEERNPPPRDKLKIRWGCTLCRDWDSIGVDVENHLKEKHNLENWDQCIEDGTLYVHYSQPLPTTSSLILPKPAGPVTAEK